MQKINSLALATLSFALVCAPKAFAQAPSTVTCQVEFEYDSTNYSQQELMSCVDRMNRENLKLLHVLASSSPEGTTEYNTKLADERASKIKSDLSSRFPNLEVLALGAGESSSLGKTAQILAVQMKDQPPAQAAAPAPVVEAQPPVASVTTVTTTLTSPTERNARVAARAGRDRYRPVVGQDGNFVAAGAEVAWLPQTDFSPFGTAVRGEIGVSGSALNDEGWVDAAGVHAFAGPGYRISSAVIGARALIGGTWDRASKWRADGGGELRLGYEGDDLSIFAGVGQTTRLTKVGIDLGVLL